VVTRRIGLDFGGVITDSQANDGTDTAFRTDNFMATTAVIGTYTAVKILVSVFGRDNLFIISKCGEITEAKSIKWLRGNGFYEATDFDPSNVFFCRERADKAPIAADLGLTDFVDDRADVLGYMTTVRLRWLFGPQPEDGAGSNHKLTPVRTWPKAVDAMLRAKL